MSKQAVRRLDAQGSCSAPDSRSSRADLADASADSWASFWATTTWGGNSAAAHRRGVRRGVEGQRTVASAGLRSAAGRLDLAKAQSLRVLQWTLVLLHSHVVRCASRGQKMQVMIGVLHLTCRLTT
jgi:hypothetical protein